MKRIIVYVAVLMALLILPMQGTDVGKLKPVGLIQLYKEQKTVFIVTDTGDSGHGETVDAAFENLEDTTSGVIFLDTADFLLVSRTAMGEVQELKRYLKPSVRMCIAGKETDLQEAAEYLAVHRPTRMIKEVGTLRTMQTLARENGRLILK